ncbi:hypothetical protein F2Q69_00013668 [Brassica cretica]|uniref:Uncharacterized protein n=1 Tax=Brassica cretica TaxID=69181 RepID=A0A8S9QXP8_BRACR|nr:hypothetical protein F2Q69_00013668 [Brassica cretica]
MIYEDEAKTDSDRSSLAVCRTESVSGPARPFAELDRSSSVNGRAESVLGPARRMAELVACLIHLGHPPSWTGSAWRMAELVVLVDPARPSAELNGIPEDARILAKRQILGSRTRVFDTMPRDVRDQCAGFRARPRFNHGLGGAMTTLAYVFRIVFDLIPSRFKVCDMFSAYVTCMVGIEHLFEDNF